MKLIIFIIAPLLIAFSGCEEKQKVIYEHNAWENHDIEVCGVQDPLENMDWLKTENQIFVDIYDHSVQSGYSFHHILSVYTNDTTGENRFIIRCQNSFEGYDCDGKHVFGGGLWDGDDKRPRNNATKNVSAYTPTENSPVKKCSGCDEFFATHTFQYTIAKYTNTPVNGNN